MRFSSKRPQWSNGEGKGELHSVQVQSHQVCSQEQIAYEQAGDCDDGNDVNVTHQEECASLVETDEKEGIPTRHAPHRNRKDVWYNLKCWIPEIAASILSLATLVAMILVLYNYNNRASSALHLPTPLTLNGLVAALSTINRAFLMAPVASAIMQELWLHYSDASIKERCPAQLRDMDTFSAASRGTLGSLSFLYHASVFSVKRRSSRIVASLGAIITIISLGFSTFTQQLISYNELKVSNNSRPGDLPRADKWDMTIPSYNSELPPREMVAALYTGTLTNNIQSASGYCPSGNCTWPLTPSMAICGSCAPTTFQKTTCFTQPNPYHQYDPNSLESLPLCNYTLASGSIATLYDFETDPIGECGNCNIGYAFRVLNESFPDDKKMYLAHFSMIGVPQGFTDLPNFETSIVASQCSLWMCINTYNTSVKASTITEKIPFSSSALESPINTTDIYGLSASHPALVYPNMTAMKVTWTALDAMYFLGPAMAGYVTMTATSHSYSNDLIYGAWNGSKNPTAWIDNVATSLSNVIRTMGGANATDQYQGVSYELGVTVRWKWIVLPVVMVLSSIGLLIAVMVKSARSAVGVWKGSPLTFLLFDVDDTLKQAAAGRAMEYRGFEKAIGKTRVVLREMKGMGWRFEEVNQRVESPRA